MTKLRLRLVLAAAAVAALLLIAALYFGPHWTVSRMRAAVASRDPAALSEYIDFPSLRESFKAQLVLKMTETANAPGMRGNPFAALGQMLVMKLVDPMVDTLVTPAGVMVMLQEGRPQVTPGGLMGQGAPQPPPEAVPPPPPRPVPQYRVDHVDWSTAEIHAVDAGPQKFILRRQGLFSWKLAAVEMAL